MVSHFTYLAGLLLGIAGLLVLDRRYRLAFWSDRRRTWRSIGIGMFVFVAWDAAGIIGTIFAHGASRFSLPVLLAPNFPIEEVFFLFLFVYTTLLLYRGLSKGKRA